MEFSHRSFDSFKLGYLLEGIKYLPDVRRYRFNLFQRIIYETNVFTNTRLRLKQLAVKLTISTRTNRCLTGRSFVLDATIGNRHGPSILVRDDSVVDI